MLLGRYAICQYAYFVNDMDAAAHNRRRLFGARPWCAGHGL